MLLTPTPGASPPLRRVGPRLAVAAAAAAQLVLLAALGATVGLGLPGRLTGAAFAAGLGVLVVGAARRAGAAVLGPADLVTLGRSVLVGGVTALVADGLATGRDTPVALLVVLAAVALALDGVDGRVARRTRTVSAFGARFDMEVDSFLVLVLSVHAATTVTPWALAIGAMRYAFVAASWVLPWLRGALPVRYSAKVVAASAGIVLVVVAAGVLPPTLAVLLVLAVLVALTWSFGGSVAWLWRARGEGADDGASPPVAPSDLRRDVDRTLTVLAALAVFVALVAPRELGMFTPWALLRIPVEAIVGIVLVLVLPRRLRGWAAGAGGAALGVLVVLKALDVGFLSVLGRPFDPVLDWVLLGNAREFLAGSLGRAGALGATAAAVLLAVLAVVLLVVAARRLGHVVGRHRTGATRAAAVLSVAWLAAFALGLQVVEPVPVASRSAAALAYEKAAQVPVSLRDSREFAAQAAHDTQSPATAAAPEEMLAGLRGKDVVLTFIESYGRSAVEDPRYAPEIGAALAAGSERLTAKGFAARSGWLTSSVIGGRSWMAHATLVSGLKIDNQQRYHSLTSSDRLTLSKAFQNAGWETANVMPGTERVWPEAGYFGFDRVYDRTNMGYRGPKFAWSPLPDQYAFATLQREEHGRAGRGPLMAQVELTSSHVPWWPYPSLVDWDAVGDGSVFDEQVEGLGPPERVWKDDDRTREAYRDSTAYSLETVLSYVERYGDDRLVLVFLGDHQPASLITGDAPSYDVPITIVTRDRAVLDRIAGWGWADGLKPGPGTPVWPMEAFRDRFMSAFGAPPTPQ